MTCLYIMEKTKKRDAGLIKRLHATFILGISIIVFACQSPIGQGESFPDPASEGTVVLPTQSVMETTGDRSELLTATPSDTKEYITTTIPIITPTSTSDNRIISQLPPGRYIVYTNIKDLKNPTINIISEDGVEERILVRDGGNKKNVDLLPDNKSMAFLSTPGPKLRILDLETGNIAAMPYGFGCEMIGEYSWGNDNSRLAVPCGNRINIVSYPDGKIFEVIEVKAYERGENRHYNAEWSPNGKWIAFYMFSGGQLDNERLNLTDMDCLEDPGSCTGKTKWFMDIPQEEIEWTPSNRLAMLDPYEDKIFLYNPVSLSLERTIVIPETIFGAKTLVWSTDDEWVAIGTDRSIYIFSVITGEARLLTKKSGTVLFWIEIP
jgi:Tol biopolymer transport system component